MTGLRFPAFAAALAIAGCSAAALEPEAASFAAQTAPIAPHFDSKGDGDLFCDVTAEPTADGVLIEAHAFSDRDVYGEYDLAITKSGRAGSADLSQRGEVEIEAGTETTLGATELSMERGARIDADLVVRDGQGELCRRSVRL